MSSLDVGSNMDVVLKTTSVVRFEAECNVAIVVGWKYKRV